MKNDLRKVPMSAKARKLPVKRDVFKIALSGTIKKPGGYGEGITINRNTDYRYSQGNRRWYDGQRDLP
jgi:hypothetical protein